MSTLRLQGNHDSGGFETDDTPVHMDAANFVSDFDASSVVSDGTSRSCLPLAPKPVTVHVSCSSFSPSSSRQHPPTNSSMEAAASVLVAGSSSVSNLVGQVFSSSVVVSARNIAVHTASLSRLVQTTKLQLMHLWANALPRQTRGLQWFFISFIS